MTNLIIQIEHKGKILNRRLELGKYYDLNTILMGERSNLNKLDKDLFEAFCNDDFKAVAELRKEFIKKYYV